VLSQMREGGSVVAQTEKVCLFLSLTGKKKKTPGRAKVKWWHVIPKRRGVPAVSQNYYFSKKGHKKEIVNVRRKRKIHCPADTEKPEFHKRPKEGAIQRDLGEKEQKCSIHEERLGCLEDGRFAEWSTKSRRKRKAAGRK